MRYKKMLLLACGFLLLPAACGRQRIHSVPPGEVYRESVSPAPETPADEDAQSPGLPEKPKTPGEVASIRLTDQARRYLEAGDAESAIRVLERSVALHPYNGEGYFLLAEAWILKKDPGRALTFNRMARTYLPKEASWQKRIQDQYQRISALK